MSIFLTKPIKVPLNTKDATSLVASFVGIKSSDIISLNLHKQSVDARDKSDVHFVCSFLIDVNKNIVKNATLYQAPIDVIDSIVPQKVKNKHKVIVVGAGPSGLFCALFLAKSGYSVTVVERGSDLQNRKFDVQKFFNGGDFNPNSNIQFGLGGAGTFSDGKLTSGISSPYTFTVFNQFVKFGAPKDIMYSALPHIGTDYLSVCVDNLKKSIIDYHGEFIFNTLVNEIVTKDGQVTGVKVSSNVSKNQYFISADAVFLACGHSSRDTFEMLNRIGASLSFKPFAVGLRIEHSRKFIDYSQYGIFATHRDLQSASYKLVYNDVKRSCYSFCMCPGGVVVAANSTSNSVVVNGMSNYLRNAPNSNSALVVTVNQEDLLSWGYDGLFAGVRFQEDLEKKAYVLGGGNYIAPCQNVTDFVNNRSSNETNYGEFNSSTSQNNSFDFSNINLLQSKSVYQPPFYADSNISNVSGNVIPNGNCYPSYPRGVKFCNLRTLLPLEIGNLITDGLNYFDKKIHGFGSSGVLTGVETRTSSPIRIVRDKETFQSNLKGLYPMGEGAGYAGGIVSASVDGLRCAIAFDKLNNN